MQGKNGAAGRDRTCDLLVTNELLYQLSYSGTYVIIAYFGGKRKFCRLFAKYDVEETERNCEHDAPGEKNATDNSSECFFVI